VIFRLTRRSASHSATSSKNSARTSPRCSKDAGYLSSHKTIDESGSLTLLSLTVSGRAALDAYRAALRDLFGGV